MSSTDPADVLIRAVRDLGNNVDLSGVVKEIEAVKRRDREAVEEELAGLAKLTMRGKLKTKRFVVAFWYNDKPYTVEAIEWPDPREDKSKELYYLVRMQRGPGVTWPWGDSYKSRKELEESLRGRNVPFVIEDDK